MGGQMRPATDYETRIGPPERAVRFQEGKLFLGGLDESITTQDINEYCSQWGEVIDSVVMDAKNYGFVTFRQPTDAMSFLEQRDHVIRGRRVDAKAAVPKHLGGNTRLTRKLFVGGTRNLKTEDFVEHFAKFGTIEDAVIVHREGVSRGFGFVTFSDEVSVEKCLVVSHTISGKKVELKRAIPKEEMEATEQAAAAAAAAAGGAGAAAGGGGTAYSPYSSPPTGAPGAYFPQGGFMSPAQAAMHAGQYAPMPMQYAPAAAAAAAAAGGPGAGAGGRPMGMHGSSGGAEGYPTAAMPPGGMGHYGMPFYGFAPTPYAYHPAYGGYPMPMTYGYMPGSWGDPQHHQQQQQQQAGAAARRSPPQPVSRTGSGGARAPRLSSGSGGNGGAAAHLHQQLGQLNVAAHQHRGQQPAAELPPHLRGAAAQAPQRAALSDGYEVSDGDYGGVDCEADPEEAPFALSEEQADERPRDQQRHAPAHGKQHQQQHQQEDHQEGRGREYGSEEPAGPAVPAAE